ncbi:hypothetical protein PoB_004327300 [Plakobranchus ocellatus]|uniref:Uncharacterized protein n=1 Tax=Plakobranchus ocellatus TaxID=259542 RepID=A0AAV4BD11_9GAST|nr:hypothetical protein PoB_004327300 [Plakobranchus ocellatus]
MNLPEAKITHLTFLVEPVHNKVISGFHALRQAMAPVAGFEPATWVPEDLRALSVVPPTPVFKSADS